MVCCHNVCIFYHFQPNNKISFFSKREPHFFHRKQQFGDTYLYKSTLFTSLLFRLTKAKLIKVTRGIVGVPYNSCLLFIASQMSENIYYKMFVDIFDYCAQTKTIGECAHTTHFDINSFVFDVSNMICVEYWLASQCVCLPLQLHSFCSTVVCDRCWFISIPMRFVNSRSFPVCLTKIPDSIESNVSDQNCFHCSNWHAPRVHISISLRHNW